MTGLDLSVAEELSSSFEPCLKKQDADSKEEIPCVVPLHHELAIGTLRGILRQARAKPEKFMENL